MRERDGDRFLEFFFGVENGETDTKCRKNGGLIVHEFLKLLADFAMELLLLLLLLFPATAISLTLEMMLMLNGTAGVKKFS